jgi:hypothetical protein
MQIIEKTQKKKSETPNLNTDASIKQNAEISYKVGKKKAKAKIKKAKKTGKQQ